MHLFLLGIRLLIFACIFLLTACSVFSPVKIEQPTTYVLNTLPTPVTKKPLHHVTLLVTQPAVNEIYDTAQMAYTSNPYQVAYFAKSRWIDTPAQMLQPLLAQALQDTHYFYAIGLPPALGQYDYILNTRLLQFEQHFAGSSSQFLITLRAQIVKTINNQVIAAKQFTVVEPAFENTPYGGVVAANKAIAKILFQVTQFCLQEIR